MRIAFLWKWWSWKSTTSTSFASYLHKTWRNTVFADADINVNWLQILWFDLSDFPYLSDKQKVIMDFAYGERCDVTRDEFLWVSPASDKSNFYRLNEQSLSNISRKNSDNLIWMWIWAYNEDEIWFNCYHGKSDWFVCFLNHLMDKNEEYLIVDSVTGIDNASTPLAYSYNLNVIVVEPTKKSISVCTDFQTMLEKHDINSEICVIWNKVEDEDDEEFIKKNIWNAKFLWSLKFSESMKKFDQWDKESFNQFVDENKDLYEKILNYAHVLKFDWNNYYNYIFSYYQLMCQSYYNQYFWKSIDHKIVSKLDYNSIRENELSKD